MSQLSRLRTCLVSTAAALAVSAGTALASTGISPSTTLGTIATPVDALPGSYEPVPNYPQSDGSPVSQAQFLADVAPVATVDWSRLPWQGTNGTASGTGRVPAGVLTQLPNGSVSVNAAAAPAGSSILGRPHMTTMVWGETTTQKTVNGRVYLGSCIYEIYSGTPQATLNIKYGMAWRCNQPYVRGYIAAGLGDPLTVRGLAWAGTQNIYDSTWAADKTYWVEGPYTRPPTETQLEAIWAYLVLNIDSPGVNDGFTTNPGAVGLDSQYRCSEALKANVTCEIITDPFTFVPSDDTTCSTGPICTAAESAQRQVSGLVNSTTQQIVDTVNAAQRQVLAQAEEVRQQALAAIASVSQQVDGLLQGVQEAIADNEKPAFSVSGSLYDHRNRDDDHRQEGLYDPTAAIHVFATDGPVTSPYAGIASVAVFVDGQRVFFESACAATCAPTVAYTSDYTMNTDDFTDGTHQIRVDVTDQKDNKSSASWSATIDRRGDVQRASLYSGNPAGGGELVGVEDAVPAAGLARVEASDEEISTVSRESCPTGSCAVGRRVSPAAYSPSHADAYVTTIGTSPDDSRVLDSSVLLSAAAQQGQPVATGDILDALEPWQRPPAAHGTEYETLEESDSVVIAGEQTAVTSRLTRDATTHLPLKTEVVKGGATTSRTLYSYESRRTRAELPGDHFAPARPASVDYDSNRTLAPISGTSAGPQEPSDAELLEQAVAFRQYFGFNADPGYVASLLADTSLEDATDRFSTPLVPAEVDELDARLALQAARPGVRQYLATQSTSAGSFLDQDGVLRVGFTTAPEQQLTVLQSLVPDPNRVAVFLAERSASQLQQLADAVMGDWDSGTLPVAIGSVGIRYSTNSVVVTVSDDVQAAQAQLSQRYGPGVVAIDGAIEPARNATTAPLHPFAAGLEFSSAQNAGCTAGFTLAGTAVLRGRTHRAYFKLTAGHCQEHPETGARAGYGEPWYHKVVQRVGHQGRTAYPRPGARLATDSAYVTLERRGLESDELFIRYRNGRYRYVVVASDMHAAEEGDFVCQFGQTTDREVCGRVTQVNITSRARVGGTLTDITEVNLAHCGNINGGDSGGPVYTPSGRRGVVLTEGIILGENRRGCSSGTARFAYYTGIKAAIDNLPSGGQPTQIFEP